VNKVNKVNKKKQNIETLRGLACVLLIFNHLIGTPLVSGLRVELESVYPLINTLLENIRMPLFAFLGGYIFALRPQIFGSEVKMLIGKSKRLLLPLLFVGVPFVFIQGNSSYSNASIETNSIGYYFSILWQSRFHYWFLQAMFLVFLFCAFLSYVKIDFSRGLKFTFPMSIFISFFVSENINLFSLSGAVYLLPYFLFGAICFLNENYILNKIKAYWFVVFTIVTCLLMFKFNLEISQQNFERISVLGYITSFCGLLLLFVLRIENRLLAKIGRYSFSIYLYHVFCLALIRTLLNKVGIYSIEMQIFIGLTGAILISIAIEVFCRQKWFLSWPFLGQKPQV